MIIYVLLTAALVELVVIFLLFSKFKKESSSNVFYIQDINQLKKTIKLLKSNVKSFEMTNNHLRDKIKSLTDKIALVEKANLELAKKKEELIIQNEKLEELQRQKEEFFAIAIHDIKNPAAAIKGYLDLLNSYDLTVQEQQEIIQGMIASSEQIFRLTREITEIVAQDQTGSLIQKELITVKDIIDSVVTQNLAYAQSKKIKLINKSSPDLPKVYADRDKIEDVIDNLVNNAIKYGPPGTLVYVSTFFTASKLTVEVNDDGVGLNEEDKKRIFEKGAKLSPRPTGNESSSGLGLWIVKKIIEEHGGTVFVQSKSGVGSKFGFQLPIETQQR
ncbi:MAG: HAMP domain-containing histidine kinase [Chlorobi bacterium]|nr:HAMP domain-containing histidine kinase [Chlorobiota bacterium]